MHPFHAPPKQKIVMVQDVSEQECSDWFPKSQPTHLSHLKQVNTRMGLEQVLMLAPELSLTVSSVQPSQVNLELA